MRTATFLLAMFGLAGLGAAPLAQSAEPNVAADAETKPAAKAKPTPKMQRDVTRLVTHFRRAKKEPEKQAEVVAEAMQLGEPAVSAILQAIQQDLQPQLDRYRNKFYQQAVLLAKQQGQKVDLEELGRLRSSVLALRQDPNLTKDKIVAVADPAMKRLEEMFLLRPEMVLAQSPDLQAERQKLAPLGVMWERCNAWLHAAAPADESKPKDAPTFVQYLAGEEELATGLALPMDPVTREVLATNAKLATQLDPEEARAILALNLTRNLLGLKPVVIDLKLCAAARDHSKDMATHKFFAHESPVPGKKTPWDRAKNFGTSASAENIFMGISDGRAANLGWFHSPGHHKNMLAEHKRVGMGRHGVHFTEMFGD